MNVSALDILLWVLILGNWVLLYLNWLLLKELAKYFSSINALISSSEVDYDTK